MSSRYQNAYGLPKQISSITRAGRVVFNVDKSRREIMKRRESRKRKATFYPSGGSEQELFTIMDGELTLMEAARMFQSDGNARSYGGEMEVLSSINWMGDSHEGVDELIERFQFGGIAAGHDAHNPMNQAEDDTRLPVQIGGLTTITVTGPEVVKVGDFLYWTLPDARVANKRPWGSDEGVPANKIYPWVVPYVPNKDDVTVASVYKMLHHMWEDPEQAALHHPTPLREAAMGFAQIIRVTSANAVFDALRAGLVILTPGSTSPLELKADRLSLANRTQTEREEEAIETFMETFERPRATDIPNSERIALLERLYAAFGAIEHNIFCEAKTIVPGGRADTTEWLGRAVVERFFGKNTVWNLVRRNMNTRGLVEGFMGTIFRLQTSAGERCFRSYASANYFTTGRIFGMALNSAPPGGDVDVALTRVGA